ncbi:prolyl oligopeptidase family serine peptidase [Chryseobacterium sp. Leaf394]|uniref:alpha/beta hydrolase family protein n=1 Tax=Chryseobacterium sp. Leaf394 TaxID=1736361 RepID=UPI0006F8E40C|nr:prolyl oligopeptidase family serine peptidase [Chryseobacterium sp. Leaf394]KQS93218.1 hypothetical protein ASG21_12595 [Chryseobacterium sp. Leaf394]
MKTAFITLIVIFLSATVYSQRTQDDSLKLWASKFSDLKWMINSEDGKYAALTLIYPESNDTVFVFSHQRKVPSDTVIGMSDKKSFLGKLHFFAVGAGNAQLLNLQTHQKITFKKVRTAEVMKDVRQFCILDKNKTLSIYNLSGKRILKLLQVEKMTSGKSKVFITTTVESTGSKRKNELLEWNGKKIFRHYSTENTIEKTELLSSQNFLAIREQIIGETAKRMVLLDIKKGKIYVPELIQPVKTDAIKIAEAGNDGTFLVSAESRTEVSDSQMVEVWYGSDKNLRSARTGKRNYRFWYWKPEKKIITELPSEKSQVYVPLNNSRYLWMFSSKEVYNYIHATPMYDIYLYDIEKNTSLLAFNESSEVIGSMNGNFAVSHSRKTDKWIIFDLEHQGFTEIDGSQFSNPVFSSDSKILLFSGKSDLFAYDLKTKKLSAMKISDAHEVTIMNKKINVAFGHLKTRFRTFTADLSKPLQLQIYDENSKKTSVLRWERGKTSVLIPLTSHKIKEVSETDNHNSALVYSVEENHNIPPGIYRRNTTNGKTELLYRTNRQDKRASDLKTEVLSYKNSSGRPLKAILSYPENFDVSKKYPVIVRIYQKQSDAASAYIRGEIKPDGFNKRLMLDRGYFIYQPDVVFDERGTGISALDCVHAALDALRDFTYIDQEKIGLSGHSMGGYEVNFIATHSTRFAAYLSGASVANIMQSYFSYNRLFEIPDYGRFEGGQFEINRPYVGNEELYFRNNPVNYVQHVSAPILMWSGRKDGNVLPEQTEAFYIGLLRNRKKVIALFYRDQEHTLGYNTPEAFDLNRRTVDWWDYFLKDRKNVEWIDREMNEGR